jgi:hypothetical protein
MAGSPDNTWADSSCNTQSIAPLQLHIAPWQMLAVASFRVVYGCSFRRIPSPSTGFRGIQQIRMFRRAILIEWHQLMRLFHSSDWRPLVIEVLIRPVTPDHF